jgi:hypothetical protein
VRRSLNGRVAVQDRPSPEGAEMAIATQTPPRKRVLRRPKQVGRRQSGWCGGALGCLGVKGSREKLKFAARGRKLGRGGNGGLNSGVWCRCEGEREGGPGRGSTWRRRGGPVTLARAWQRWAPIGRRCSACGEETEEGRTWVGPGEKERKWVAPNRTVKFSIYSNNFQMSSNCFD